MRKLKSYVGKKYGKLTVVKELPSVPYEYNKWIMNKRWFNCICDCGNKLDVRINSLVKGNTKSCGCLAIEQDLSYWINGEEAKNYIREEIKIYKNGRRRKGYVYLCKCCKKEIFLLPPAIPESKFLCKKCSTRENQKLRYIVSEGTKECKYCERKLDVSEFSLIQNGQRLQAYCKRCNYLQLYGISAVNYDNMFENQQGKCKICKLPESDIYPQTGKIKSLAVDHCHKSGKVRGLLCSKCNKGIGLLNDDITLLKEAIKYLKTSKNIKNE